MTRQREMVDVKVYSRALFDRDLAMLRAGIAEAVAAAALQSLAIERRRCGSLERQIDDAESDYDWTGEPDLDSEPGD